MSMPLAAGRMPRLVATWGVAALGGDCVSVTSGIFCDLACAENLEHVWLWVSCVLPAIGGHHFVVALDHDAVTADPLGSTWVVDASNGSKRAALVLRGGAFVRLRSPTSVRVRASTADM